MGKASRRKRERREGKAPEKKSRAVMCPDGCGHMLSEHYLMREQTELGFDVYRRCKHARVKRDKEASEERGTTVMANYHCPCKKKVGSGKTKVPEEQK